VETDVRAAQRRNKRTYRSSERGWGSKVGTGYNSGIIQTLSLSMLFEKEFYSILNGWRHVHT